MEKVPEACQNWKKKTETYYNAMPWLKNNYTNWRDEDKMEIPYVVDKDKIYPESITTDNNLNLPAKKPDYRSKPEKI